MQHSDRWPEDFEPDAPRSRSGSRRNSASSRRSSLRERDTKSPNNSAPQSLTSTPKRVIKTQNLDFTVTGKQILKRSDRANSLPGSYHRRSAEPVKAKKKFDSPKVPSVSKSHDRFLEDEVSLELSQVSDFEDLTSRGGSHFKALATSTPKPRLCQKSRSISLQNQMLTQRVERKNRSIPSKSRESTLSYSRDSIYKSASTASQYRYETDLDYSSVSPEYSGQSSTDLSPRACRQAEMSPQSQDFQLSSCCVSTWQDSEMENTKVQDCRKQSGEWDNFWVNYNNSLSRVPMKPYYDQCPTPYRTENMDYGDFDTSPENSHIRSPDDIKNLNNIIRNEGLHLTPRETQNMIKCAHILGNVLSKAIERRSKQTNENEHGNDPKMDPEREMKKKSLTLNLRETVVPIEVEVKNENATVSTQTDISLPNTKSAPKIFDSILRQLSKTTLIDSVTANKMKEKADKVAEKGKADSEKTEQSEPRDEAKQSDVPNENSEQVPGSKDTENV